MDAFKIAYFKIFSKYNTLKNIQSDKRIKTIISTPNSPPYYLNRENNNSTEKNNYEHIK